MTATSTPRDKRTNVDIRVIEHELSNLWQQATEHSPDPLTRVCVLNLLVATHSSRTADRATDVIAQLTARHPNRAIVIRAQPNDPALIDAWVQAHCHIPGTSHPQVCCEQITIEARGDAIERVPGTVLPLLVPDVPVMLWWPEGAPFNDQLFTRLSLFADRVIVDSTTFATPEADLAHMVALCNAGRAVSDLSWGQLTPWRELVAQFFDIPTFVPHLAHVTRLVVKYEAQPKQVADRTQALLLVGWFAERLRWSLADDVQIDAGVTTIPMQRADGQPIVVELHPAVPQEDRLARLAAVTLECETARFHITRGVHPNCAVATAEVNAHPPLQRVVRLERLSNVDLLGEELHLLGHDVNFESALRMAAQLVQS